MTDLDIANCCRFCGCREGRAVFPKEMYFGTRKMYRYFHCSDCGGLSCEDTVPVSEAYPKEYYSFQTPVEIREDCFSKTKSLLRKLKTSILLGNSSILRAVVIALFSEQYLFPWFRYANLTKSSSILDVGCGTGGLLLYLNSCGFRNLTGIDPNIENDIVYGNGVSIAKKALDDAAGKFDFIIFHHVIEHTANPTETLIRSMNLLKDDGHIFIFTPVSDCYAFRKYGAYWASIDAPRHLAIPSIRSIHLIAEKAGLSVKELGFVSGTFQFQNSELYAANIATVEAYSGRFNETVSYKKQQKIFLRAAKWLDNMHDGDVAIFLLKKKLNNAVPGSSGIRAFRTSCCSIYL